MPYLHGLAKEPFVVIGVAGAAVTDIGTEVLSAVE